MRYAALLIVLSFPLVGCTTRNQVARVASPDGLLDALVFESDCGAICDVVDEVWVVPRGSRHGKEVASFNDAVRSEHAWGKNVKWDSGHRLVFEYFSAAQAKLLMQKTVIAGQDVQVSLRDGISDPLARAGEMLDHTTR